MLPGHFKGLFSIAPFGCLDCGIIGYNEKAMNIYHLTGVLLVAVGISILLEFGLLMWGLERKQIINCSQFASQSEAQAAFDSDPVKYEGLDRGGIEDKPCESLG